LKCSYNNFLRVIGHVHHIFGFYKLDKVNYEDVKNVPYYAMRLFEKCPACGGELAEKEVEKVLTAGTNSAVVTLKVELCLQCGERLYTPEAISRLEGTTKKLIDEDMSEFELIGKTYHVA